MSRKEAIVILLVSLTHAHDVIRIRRKSKSDQIRACNSTLVLPTVPAQLSPDHLSLVSVYLLACLCTAAACPHEVMCLSEKSEIDCKNPL